MVGDGCGLLGGRRGRGKGAYPDKVDANGLCITSGYMFHGTGACPALTRECSNCDKVGHFYYVCTSNPQPARRNGSGNYGRGQGDRGGRGGGRGRAGHHHLSTPPSTRDASGRIYRINNYKWENEIGDTDDELDVEDED